MIVTALLFIIFLGFMFRMFATFNKIVKNHEELLYVLRDDINQLKMDKESKND